MPAPGKAFQTGNDPRRVGNGRKPKAEKYAGAVVAAENQIRDRLPQIVDAAIVAALAGDVSQQQYLMNRLMGKPTERVEQEMSGGFQIDVVYTNDWDQGSTE